MTTEMLLVGFGTYVLGLVTRYGVKAVWFALKLAGAWLTARAKTTPDPADDALAAAFNENLGDKPPEGD